MISEYINGMEILAESARATLKDEKPKQEAWAIRGRPINIYSEDISRMNLFPDIYESASPYNLMEPEIPMLIDIEKLIGDISDTKSEIIKIDKKFREDITNLRYTHEDTKESILEYINTLTKTRQENKRRMFLDIKCDDFHYTWGFNSPEEMILHHKFLTLNEIMEKNHLISASGKSHVGMNMAMQLMQRNPTLSPSSLLGYKGKSCHVIETSENIIKEKNNKGKSKYHN